MSQSLANVVVHSCGRRTLELFVKIRFALFPAFCFNLSLCPCEIIDEGTLAVLTSAQRCNWNNMPTEADTCRTRITPALQAAGWELEPHSIAEQRSFTDTETRAEIIEQLAERGIDFATIAAQAGKPDADPFDLLCHLAFNAPVLTRRQRADRVKKQQAAMFDYLKPEAQEILDQLLEKYATDGEVQFLLPDILKVPPISKHGNVNEIIGTFGGTDQLRTAVSELQTLLYTT